MITTLKFLFYTELILLLRRSQEWLYPLGFFVIIITLFPLAFSPDPTFLAKYLPGCVWIAALLASLMSIESIFERDKEEGYLDQLLLGNIPLTLAVIAKLSALWVVTAMPLILLTPIIAWAFQLPAAAILPLCTSLLLGTPIILLLGSLGAALTLGLRQQGVLLSLLILPLVMPVLIFGVNLVQQAIAGFSITAPLAFLAGVSILSITLLPWAIAVTLGMSGEE